MDPVLGARILLRSPGYLGQDFKSEFLCKALRDQALGINGSYDKCPFYQLALQAIISAFPPGPSAQTVRSGQEWDSAKFHYIEDLCL